MDLIDILRSFETDRASGIMMLLREGERKALFLSDGKIIHAHSNQPGEKFVDFLLADTAIDDAQLEQLRSEKTKNTHLGVMLLEKKLIYPLAMRDVLRKMITEIAASVFRWEQGEYYFSAEVYNPVIEEHATVPMGAVILEGVRALGSDQPWLKNVAPAKGWMRLIPDRKLSDLCFQLSDEEEIFFAKLKREVPIENFMKASSKDADSARLLLAGLIMAGYMDVETDEIKPPQDSAALAPRESPRTLQTAQEGKSGDMTYNDLLNAFRSNCPQVHRHVPGHEKPIWERRASQAQPSGVPQAQTSARPRVDAKQYRVPPVIVQRRTAMTEAGPAKPGNSNTPEGRPPAPPKREEVTFIPLQHAASPNVQLDDTVQTDRPTQTKLRQQKKSQIAEELYLKAQANYKQGRFPAVVRLLEDAIRLVPDQAKYYNLLGLTQVRNPQLAWQKRAEESFRAAIEKDPWQPEFFINLANLYQKRGLASRAIKNYKLALMLDPRNQFAIQELDKLIVGL